jgi:polyvinyl alcohol dehydrogenase (cytochrome)
VAISDVVTAKKGAAPALHAVEIARGRRKWSKPAPTPACAWGTNGCSHAQSAAVTAIPGVVFSGALDGHLRAYASSDGTILWDIDTARPYDTVNGLAANGGSLDTGGAVVVDGVLYVNSGYALVAGRPGNVLLAFSVDGK